MFEYLVIVGVMFLAAVEFGWNCAKVIDEWNR